MAVVCRTADCGLRQTRGLEGCLLPRPDKCQCRRAKYITNTPQHSRFVFDGYVYIHKIQDQQCSTQHCRSSEQKLFQCFFPECAKKCRRHRQQDVTCLSSWNSFKTLCAGSMAVALLNWFTLIFRENSR